MFDRGGWKPEGKEDEKKIGRSKPEPRFSMRVIAAQRGKPIPEYTRDRVFNDTRPVSSGSSRPKRTPKTPAPPKTEKAKPMKDVAIERSAPVTAQQAGEGIRSTTDYGQFTFLPTNRPIDRVWVRRLVKVIGKKNLLHLNPIIVDSDNGVIEGQHRLEAAKILGVPIFFIMNDQVTQDDMASMNSNKKNWALVDYMHFYEAKGIRPYAEFMNFYRERGAGLPVAIVLTIATEKGSLKSNYKDGILDITNLKIAGEVISYLQDFKPYTPFYNSAKFIEALAFIVRTGLYDHGHMIVKLNGNPLALQPQPQMKGWILELQRAYNKHVREDKIVTFLKRI